MATATCRLSEDQFLCSICLAVFTDPVTIPCGHNFCKKCIDQQWCDDDKCKCPYCKTTFPSRPELKVNIFIADMVDQFKQSQIQRTTESEAQAVAPGEVLCDVCTGPKQRALQSCLVCQSSYCESHLEPHLNMLGLKKHQLLEPKTGLKAKVCPQHNKALELFCERDQQSVCVLCLDSDHRNHQVVSLKAASEKHRLRLQKTEDSLQNKISLRVEKIDELRGTVGLSDAAADREISDGVTVFNSLKESVETALDLLISDLTKKKTETQQQAEGLIQEIELEISALQKRQAEVKLLSQSDDPLHLLQHSPPLMLKPQTINWKNVHVPIQTYEGAVERALSELEKDFNHKTKVMFKPEVERAPAQEADLPMAPASPPLWDNHTDTETRSSDTALNRKDKTTRGKKKVGLFHSSKVKEREY